MEATGPEKGGICALAKMHSPAVAYVAKNISATCVMDGLSIFETARVLGLPHGTVKAHMLPVHTPPRISHASAP